MEIEMENFAFFFCQKIQFSLSFFCWLENTSYSHIYRYNHYYQQQFVPSVFFHSIDTKSNLNKIFFFALLFIYISLFLIITVSDLGMGFYWFGYDENRATMKRNCQWNVVIIDWLLPIVKHYDNTNKQSRNINVRLETITKPELPVK